MPAVRHAWIVPGLLAALAGCAGSGSSLAPRTSLGSLKTSVSHLEYENQQLRREVATLKDDNRQIENRLVQEESLNGDLSARLDDARTLLSRRGLDPGGEPLGGEIDPGPGRAQTLPAGRSNRTRRKPPFAQIPGRIDVLPPRDDDNGEPGAGWGNPSSPSLEDPGPTTRNDRSTLWLPVARGTTEMKSTRR